MRGWATVPGYRTGGPGVNWRRHDGQDARAAGGRAGDARPGADPQRCQKAWGATKRATDALILARTGEEPERTPETGAGLRQLVSLDEAVREARLLRRYYSRQGSLHGECFYNGFCDPIEDTERRIRDTADYIDDAERLAGGDALYRVQRASQNTHQARPDYPEGLNVIGGDKVGHVGGLTD